MKNSILLLCCCLTLALTLPARPADLKLEVITLHYRNAEELLPVIKPFVGGDGTVTGMNNQLIIKATSQDIAAVRQLLVNIDRRPRRLMITVTHDISETTAGSQQSIAGRYAAGSVEYHDATTGFYVIPNLNGAVVTLLISPYMTRINPDHRGVFNVQIIETTVQGRLGEWIEIGGYFKESQREHSGVLSENLRRQGQAQTTFLKVEELE